MDKTVFITGGSRGIGAGTARLFAREGWRVAVGYHRGEKAAGELVEELLGQGGDAKAFGADLADPEQARRAVAQVQAWLGHMDALVCCAGIAQQKLMTDIADEDWQRMLAVNLGGVFYTTRAALPDMIRRKRGSIVTLSSIWGMVGASCEVHYSAAKAGIIGLTKALAKDVGPSGIRVNCVAPGVVQTDMNSALAPETLDILRDETPLGRIGTVEDVASAILYLAGEQSGFVTGQVLSPNGGIVI